MSEAEDAIRLRAYQLWEKEGRPQGRHEDHWKRACDELGMAAQVTRGTDAATVKRKASRATKDKGRAKTTVESPKTSVVSPDGATSGGS